MLNVYITGLFVCYSSTPDPFMACLNISLIPLNNIRLFVFFTSIFQLHELSSEWKKRSKKVKQQKRHTNNDDDC